MTFTFIAGSGIGKDLAHKLSKMGNIIVCVDINKEANDATGMKIMSLLSIAQSCITGLYSVMYCTEHLEAGQDTILFDIFCSLNNYSKDLIYRASQYTVHHSSPPKFSLIWAVLCKKCNFVELRLHIVVM